MMNKNTVIALLLAVFLLICMPIASFAEDPTDSEEIPSVEELIELINVARDRKALFGGGEYTNCSFGKGTFRIAPN